MDCSAEFGVMPAMETILLAVLGYGLPALYLVAGVTILRQQERVFTKWRGQSTRPYRIRGTPLKVLGWLSVLPFVGFLASLVLAATVFTPDQQVLQMGPFLWAPVSAQW